MTEPFPASSGDDATFDPTEFDATLTRRSFVRRNPLASAGITILAFYVLLAVFGPSFVAVRVKVAVTTEASSV